MGRVEVERVRQLRFDDGEPVRAASAIAALADGWLVAQDDAAHAAWVRPGSVSRLRVVPPVEGHDVFSDDAGTKHLKPDLEAACAVPGGRVLLLGSGSTPARMRGVVVDAGGSRAGDLTPVYEAVARLLDRAGDRLNLEGACVVRGRLRWFARGNLAAGVPSASVDLDLPALLAGLAGGPLRDVGMSSSRTYDLGAVDGVGLAVTDAVALPDGRVLVSAAAEDTPNPVDDGPVVAAALALLDGERVLEVLPLPDVDGRVAKVEGLALLEEPSGGVRLIAVVDDDDTQAPSAELVLRVDWS